VKKLVVVAAALSLLLGVLPAAGNDAIAAGPGPGYIATDNVEWLGNIPLNADSAGARIHGGYMYVTDDRGLSIYDISNPALPLLTGFTPLPQQAYFTEEDVDTNGKILLIGSFGDLTDGVAPLNRVFVIDVTDKRVPKIRSYVDGANAHTITCVADCTYAYGSNGTIIDLRNPDVPVKLERKWWLGTPVKDSHDVTEVAPNRVVTSSNPILLLDTTNPALPTVITQGTVPDKRLIHGNLWPGGGTDKYLLVGGETSGDCDKATAGAFMTWDATNALNTSLPAADRQFKLIDQFRLETGSPLEGNSPYDQYCAHWFTPHPTYANGGLVAMGWYEHGTRFLNVDPATGKISEKGWFYPVGGSTSAAYWVNNEILYSVDYQRGIDILRFTNTPSTRTVEVPASPGYVAPPALPVRTERRPASRNEYICPLPGA
jgi:hypothetical protein